MIGGASPASPCCAACGKGNIRHQCKVCKTWLYCSRGCAKKDGKKHKKMCSRFALAEQSNTYGHLSVEECKILTNHKMARIVMSVGGGAGVERQTGNGAGAALDAGAKVSDAVFAKTAAAKIKQSRDEVENLRSLRAAAVANVKVVNASLAASLREVQGKAAEAMRYGDPSYWEERHAKDRLGGKTHEWYVDYPSTAFQQAFPSSVRDKRFLVLGCGNSELSEQMCLDRFRDVMSIDVSESAVAQMSERAPRFNSADSKCRYEVMDATQLAFDAGTFGGVVDKGTLDATLSGGKEMARRICAEAMRVLEPGGKFLIVSNSGGDVLLGPLLEMCGPEAECDEPVAVSSSPVVYAYAVRKGVPCVGEALDDRQAQPPQLPPPRARSRAAEAPSSAMVPDDVQREVAVGQASRGSAEPPATATASPGVACSEADARVGSPSSASDAVGSNSLGGRKKNWTSLSGRAPAAGGDREGGGVDERLEALRAPLLGRCESLVEQGRRRGWDEARGRSSGGSGGGGGGGGGGCAMSLPQNTSVGDEYIREEGVRPRERFPGKQQGNEHRLAKEEEALLAKITSSVEAPRKTTGEAEMRKGSASSLPWGVTEVSNNEDEFFANFELDLTTEIKKSELSVEIKATHVTVSRGPSGAREVQLDRELADKVDATESTWVIEDKTVLSVSLCKKIPGEWGRLFKDDVPPPVASSEIKGKGEIASCSSRSNGEETLPTAPTSDPVAAAPLAAPRTRKASPKSAIMACRNFVPPERFLVEDQAGIKTLQLHISKPPGLKVAECKVSRVGPEVCDVRLVCLDEARIDGQRVVFLQRSELGRESFDPDRATLSGDDAASGVCVVRVPYDVGSLTGNFGCVELGDGSGPGTGDDDDADNENVSRVARLRCRFCDHPFTPPGKGLSVRALPSGRWDECIEDMICYDGPSAVPMLARDVSYAHAGRCLVKKSAVLVHSHDVVPGSVAAVADDGNPERGGSTDADVIEGANDRHGLEWRSLKCARCELPLGRLAPSLEGQTDERRGLMLLKHCLLGDDVSEPEDARDVGDGRCSNLGVERNRQKRVGQEALSGRGGGGGGGRQRRRGALVTTPVFEGRTVIKWLMAEMEDSKHADNCSRFILAARGRSWAAPGGCLSLILIALHTRVSEHGSRKPHRAHRIAFREQSRDEAEAANVMEHGDGGEGTPESKEGERGTGGRREARVPARVLELSFGEYRAVRQRLVEAAWASTLTVYGDFTTSDSRGYSLSYLF